MDVLVYSGPGTRSDTVQYCLITLNKILSPFYSVHDVGARVLLDEPWEASTALLVFPGGADLPMCAELNGPGNERIRKYVRNGGRYFGLCAGAYYACKHIEFEKGDSKLEVSGSRELGFFPGLARGSVTPDFDYESHAGARSYAIKFADQEVNAYVNGSPCFVDAHKFPSVEVLATFKSPLRVEAFCESGDSPPNTSAAAVVLCQVGKGKALLSGPHIECDVDVLEKNSDVPGEVVMSLRQNDSGRLNAVRALLQRIGLKTADPNIKAHTLTPLFLSSLAPASTKNLVNSWFEKIGASGPEGNVLECPHDNFIVHMIADSNAVKGLPGGDQNACKTIYAHSDDWPTRELTPNFDHDLFYKTLQKTRVGANLYIPKLGNHVLYGEVVTSTSSILQYNENLLSTLPHGFLFAGAIQTAGRGRGKNVWVNPLGVMAVTGVLRIPVEKSFGSSSSSFLVFAQYVCALAMVEAIRDYTPQFSTFPVFIKWPNDIYVKIPRSHPTSSEHDRVQKIGGILTSSCLSEGEFILLFGSGTNVSNSTPPCSLNWIMDLLNEESAGLPHIQQECLLAKFLVKLEELMLVYDSKTFRGLESLYYSRWLHLDQAIRLEEHGNMGAIVRGIDPDHGTLVVEETNKDGYPMGRRIQLQPDGNSFDMLKGLVKRKTQGPNRPMRTTASI